MASKTSSIWRDIKGNLVIFFILLSLIFIDILVLYLLSQKAREEKREIIRSTQIDQLDQASAAANEIHLLFQVGGAREALEAAADRFLRAENMFFRIEFYPFISPQEKVTARTPSFAYEVPEKIPKLNNFRNCLFSRTFNEFRVFRKPLGMFYVYNATPPDVPEIELLVQKYRLLAGLFLLFYGLLVYVMLRQIVFPLRRVSRSLERMSEEYIPLLEKPKASIEIAYNSMAKNARLTQLGVLLNELVSDTSKEMLRGEDPVVESAKRVPPIICDYMNFGRVILFHRDEGTGFLEWGFGYDVEAGQLKLPPGFGEKIDYTDMARRKRGLLARTADLGLTGVPEGVTRDQESCAIVPILHNDRPICHAVLWTAKRGLSDTELLENAETIRGEIEEIFLKIISRRSLLDKEKNEVSIHLSTNLGHDMTNIIATSKWDLDTLKKGVDLGIVQVQGQPIQKERFIEAVQGLLSNTRMLQEVVNIYRAFGYANRPTYEEVDVHELIEELAHLFTLSTSKSVNIGFIFEAKVSQWVLEPRLIKLVLFNLLSNSVQSISKMLERGESTTGEISIETETTPEGHLAISVLDRGTGFRNEDGKPMNISEMRKIFRYGYTTKRDEARGGLGLSWVWTIITEFHDGKIIPSNRPDGGARMMLIIPPLEHKLVVTATQALKSEMPMM